MKINTQKVIAQQKKWTCGKSDKKYVSGYPGADVEDKEYADFMNKNVLVPKGLVGQDKNFIVHIEALAMHEECHNKK